MHNIFRCRYTRQLDGTYIVELEEKPFIKAVGDTIEDCEERLSDELTEQYEEILPVFDYQGVPQPFQMHEKSELNNYVILNTFESGHAINNFELFDKGTCDACNTPKGLRSSAPFKTMSGGFTGDILFMRSIVDMPIVSQKCAELFKLAKYFELRPVTHEKKTRTQYLELIPITANIIKQSVAIKNGEKAGKYKGLLCKECGKKKSMYFQGANLNYFISNTDLNSDAFIVDGSLVVNKKLYDSISPYKLKKVQAHPLGIVAPNDIDDNPPYELY